MKDNKTINKNVLCVLICLVISFVLEITVFQYSHYRSLGVKETVIAENVNISGFTEYDTQLFIMDGEVKNLAVSGVAMNGCESLKVRAELSDEGDRYLYPLSDLEINAAGSPDAFMNIYPYGKVHEIYAHFTISEGTESVHIERISVNVPVPLRFSLSRCFIIYLILLFVSASFFLNDDMAVCTRGSKPQFFCAAAFLMIVIFVALFLCRSNPKLVSGSYSHHAQYQELAKALKDGHVDLYFYQPDEDLKAAANPYDTSSLLAEGIPYRPDYAYYKGSYYVYFGILPEILLYYPCYVLTGRSLSNVNAAFVFYVLLAVSVFALVWEAALCFGRDRFPYHLYLGLCVAGCFFANTVFLISRPDIYNIPVLAATAFITAGCALYLKAAGCEKRGFNVYACLGSFCMAATAGCRPQFLLYALPLFGLLLIKRIKDGGMSRKKIPSLVALILPWVIMAIPVCVYNHARFGSIFDFGATYSLTSNDMNHRGFNLNRIVRGLWYFFFQPPVYTTDFPYLQSCDLRSAYMGKNLTEFTFGGIFASIPLTLSVFIPLLGFYKKMNGRQRAVYFMLLIPAVIIAAFDVNGAGILYRYTCDMAPGIMLAAFLIWILFAGYEKYRAFAGKILAVLIVASCIFAFLVFCARGDAINLHDADPYLFECIKGFFSP